MAKLLLDENVDQAVTEVLLALGHEVTSIRSLQHQGMLDPEVLALACSHESILVTNNGWDFIRLHKQNQNHFGIVVFTVDPDTESLANRIHDAIQLHLPLPGKLIRVYRISK